MSNKIVAEKQLSHTALRVQMSVMYHSLSIGGMWYRFCGPPVRGDVLYVLVSKMLLN